MGGWPKLGGWNGGGHCPCGASPPHTALGKRSLMCGKGGISGGGRGGCSPMPGPGKKGIIAPIPACRRSIFSPRGVRFSVSLSHRRILQIWWDLSFLQGAQSPQLSFRWQPTQSPHRFRFFFTGFSGGSSCGGGGCWGGGGRNPPSEHGTEAEAPMPAGVLEASELLTAVEDTLDTWPLFSVPETDASLSELSRDPARPARFTPTRTDPSSRSNDGLLS